MKGGDYANYDLHFAVGALVEIYEVYSSEKTTVDRPTSPAPLPTLVRLFFEHVDPEMQWTTIWSVLDREVRARRFVKPG